MSVREINKKVLARHEAEALLFVHPEDYSPAELEALEERYPGITGAALSFLQHSKFVKGSVAVKEFGDKKEKVLFACLAKSPDLPGYADIKMVFAKIIESRKKTGISHLAVGPIGTYAKRVHANGVADTIRVAIEGSELVVDFFAPSPS